MSKESKKRNRSEDTGPFDLSLDDTLVRPPETGIDSLYDDAVEAVEKRRTKPSDATAEVAQDGADGKPEDGTADEVEKLRDRLVRTVADFDNFRKRTEREASELRKQAAGSVLRDMLEVVDNLERALSASGKLDELKQGVEMILKQQVDILRRHGVERVESVGKPFDPNVHEAVVREEGGTELDVPTVAAEMQAGFRHHDKLLRPAMVAVAVPPAKSSDVRDAVVGRADDGDEADFDYDDEHTVIGIDV